ncbi:YhbY family RNA-binding protein [Methanospirillum stamsii]|uniref:RNA-binding protein n=1 Tax=Methanospirillum stamsii TaxID=1277351 RepID=A0A2V2NBI8_9EURY|nr:YhbY family RNA-binding protein [Methanospirillum stamsii]PWR76110.1 RNA-binding protein [Methanospirillum stamsii]
MEKKKKMSDTAYHELKPTIWIGKHGVTDTIIDEIRLQVKTRDAIKIKWLSSIEINPQSIVKDSGTTLLQIRGRTMVIKKKENK